MYKDCLLFHNIIFVELPYAISVCLIKITLLLTYLLTGSALSVRWQVEVCTISWSQRCCWNCTRRTRDTVTWQSSLLILRICCTWLERWKMHCTSWTQCTAGVFYAISNTFVTYIGVRLCPNLVGFAPLPSPLSFSLHSLSSSPPPHSPLKPARGLGNAVSGHQHVLYSATLIPGNRGYWLKLFTFVTWV